MLKTFFKLTKCATSLVCSWRKSNSFKAAPYSSFISLISLFFESISLRIEISVLHNFVKLAASADTCESNRSTSSFNFLVASIILLTSLILIAIFAIFSFFAAVWASTFSIFCWVSAISCTILNFSASACFKIQAFSSIVFWWASSIILDNPYISLTSFSKLFNCCNDCCDFTSMWFSINSSIALNRS